MATTDFDTAEARFRAHYALQQASWQSACDALVAYLTQQLATTPLLEISKVEGRVKDVDEAVRKFVRKYRATFEDTNTPYQILPCITDLIGLRVVCLYEDEIELVAQAVQAWFDVVEVTDKMAAMESTEASFGYKGLHLSLRLPPDLPAHLVALPALQAWGDRTLELQVRTIVQDSWSVLDHKIKYKKSIPSELKRRINVLAALFELADREFRLIRDATAAALAQAPDETALADATPPLAGPDSTTDAAGTPSQPTPAAGAPRPRPRLPAASGELNAFTFLKIAQHFFNDFVFDPIKVDGFVDEIRAWAPEMTRARFNTLLRETLGSVKRYKQFFDERNPSTSFNPYTMMRHCLYLSDRVQFKRSLRNAARESFEAWLQDNPGALPAAT